jgi:hypothetical protein
MRAWIALVVAAPLLVLHFALELALRLAELALGAAEGAGEVGDLRRAEQQEREEEQERQFLASQPEDEEDGLHRVVHNLGPRKGCRLDSSGGDGTRRRLPPDHGPAGPGEKEAAGFLRR